MDDTTAPVLLPALALAAGSLAAFRLTFLSIPLLAALVLLGIALGRRVGWCLACLAAGALAAALSCDLPARAGERFDRDRPVEATVRIAGHWRAEEDGWAAPAGIEVLRQGAWPVVSRLDVVLHIPGETEEPPPFGALLRVRGYLSRSAGFANREPVPPGPWRLHVESRLLMSVEAPPGPLARLSGALRRRVERAYAEAGPEGEGKALARALVLGDVSGVPLAWQRALRRTGLSHLLSVSGVHVAMVAAAALLVGTALPRRLRLLLMLAAVALYWLVVGPLPALVRASVMGLLAATALLAERPPAPANALGWAVILLVLDRPALVDQPAFQLSVSATAGLLLAGPALAVRWRRLPAWLCRPLAASVGAQLFALPWALPPFHLASPLAPLANLLAVPWTGLALAVDLAWTALALAAPVQAGKLLPVLDAMAAPFGWPAEVPPSRWPGLPLLAPPPLAWALALALGAALLARRRLLQLAGAVLATALLVQAAGWTAPPRGLELGMLDVGQGDAILLRDGRHALLVDGGGWRNGDLGGRVLLPALLGERVRHLDALVLTHPDRDHCQGLVDLSAYLPVGEVWTAPGWDPESCAGQLVTVPGTRLRLLEPGEQLHLGRWKLTVLHPEPEGPGEGNERSLVLRAEAMEHRIVLTGDAERWAEARIVATWPAADLRADILKVGHHGSRTSTGEDFLAAVSPRLALISVGIRNRYRHPSPAVLERLDEAPIPILRTDRDGLILVSFAPGRRWRISLPGSPR